MKNNLLMAIFIMIPGILYGQGNQDQADLLAHLKNIKQEFISVLDQNNSRLNTFSEQQLKEYMFMRNIMDRFYSKSPDCQKFITEEIVSPQFNCVCDNIGSSLMEIQSKCDIFPMEQKPYSLIEMRNNSSANDPIETMYEGDVITQQAFELFVNEFRQVVLEYSQRKENIPLGDNMPNTNQDLKDMFADMIELIKFRPDTLMHNWPMISLIDAKIAELEAQA